MMPNKVTSADKGFKKALVRFAEMKGTKLFVGVPPEAASVAHGRDGLTVEALAAIHEYGLGVPERSFIRAWFDENAGKVRQAINVIAKQIGEGKMDLNKGMTLLGLKFVAEIQARIARNIPPPLAQQTIDRKGSSIALINTGVLRSWISYIILIAGKRQAPKKAP